LLEVIGGPMAVVGARSAPKQTLRTSQGRGLRVLGYQGRVLGWILR
jgi:hypothetical protein